MLLGGRYETLAPIASGGMATVHLGRAVGVGGFERLVAIKVMHPHIAEEHEFVDMFLDEARLAARIRHPNVVSTLDVQADGGLFIVMEYVDGPSLQALRKALRNQPLPVEIGMRIMVDALAGLHAAHELCDDTGAPLKLVHRDVTPANILIGSDGVVRLTDFGVVLADTRLSSTRGGQLKGKIPYMPPDQLTGNPVDRRCDVYAAAVVLWELLTGRRLFRGSNDGMVVQQILAGPPCTLRQANPDLPEAISAACMRALQRWPDDRYATAADFADALEDAAAESEIRLASTRKLARFVESSGAHQKLDVRRVAKLKQATTESHPSLPQPSLPSLSQPSLPRPSSSAPDDDSLPSLPVPSVRSGVTAPAATVSSRPAPPPSRIPYRAIAIGGAIAVLGVAGGLWLSQRSSAGPAPAPASSADAPAVTDSALPAPAAAPASGTATGASASASTSTSTKARPAPTATAPLRPVTKTPPSGTPPSGTPPPSKTPPAPKPNGKTYNPDRL